MFTMHFNTLAYYLVLLAVENDYFHQLIELILNELVESHSDDEEFEDDYEPPRKRASH